MNRVTGDSTVAQQQWYHRISRACRHVLLWSFHVGHGMATVLMTDQRAPLGSMPSTCLGTAVGGYAESVDGDGGCGDVEGAGDVEAQRVLQARAAAGGRLR